jgi:hypothetical protein
MRWLSLEPLNVALANGVKSIGTAIGALLMRG